MSPSIEIKAQIELCPFHVPDAVSVKKQAGKRQDGFSIEEIPLKDLDNKTIIALLEEFRNSVFERARPDAEVEPK